MSTRSLRVPSRFHGAPRARRSARRRLTATARMLIGKAKQRVRLARFLASRDGNVDTDYVMCILSSLEGRHVHTCPMCGFVGRFQPFGLPPRREARCPGCGALERHRLLAQADQVHGILTRAQALLHFAPEPLLSETLRGTCPEYLSADIADPAADVRLDIEDMDLPDAAFDTVLCCHVLEHVDDRKALAEIRRVLTPGGRLVAMVPLAEGCRMTYEDPTISDPRDREMHFGQHDHLRRYGADFRDRVRAAGFALEEFTAEGEDAIRYGLRLGEKVFICTRRA